MARSKKDKSKRKPPILRWRGVMRDNTKIVRLTVAAVLAISCAALSLTQLGFAGIGTPGQFEAYAVVLLLPIALGALLLGTLAGTGLGLIAGGVLLCHAKIMPLDFYEMMFITPMTSVVMLGVSGFLLGIMFAFALRNNPTPLRTSLYITIVCFIVSFLYSFGFFVNVVIEIIQELAATYPTMEEGSKEYQSAMENVMSTAMHLGSLPTQMLVDALLMSFFCIVGFLGTRKATQVAENIGLRGLFASWLSVVVLIAFMATAGLSFAIITQSSINSAAQHMTSETEYLHKQLTNAEQRSNSIVELLDQSGVDYSNVSEEMMSRLIDSLSVNGLLDGYSKEADGTVLLLSPSELSQVPNKDADSEGDLQKKLSDSIIILSDDEKFKKGTRIGSIIDDDVIRTIAASLLSGEVYRSVFDDTNGLPIEEAYQSRENVHSEIIYLYAEQVDEDVLLLMMPASKVFDNRSATMAWTTLSAFVLLIAVFAMVFQLLNRVVVRRIDETNGVLGRITNGDLNARVDIRDTREFKSLSNDINTTVDTLKGWIAEAETRMDAELATAKAIQESALPRTFPPYPDILKFDIYASMKAAKEVGGDFYDFFLIGDDAGPDSGKLGFVIADVSGKGVPAALFMMKAMTQIRDYLQSGMEIGEAIENANRQLVDGNDAGMFVTAWVGVLDYATGHIEFVNAGHNPPLLWQKGSNWRWVEEKSGLPLGLFEGLPYDAHSLECEIGDEFLLYTDGVTEAMDVEGELYGEKRLMALVEANYTLHPRRLVSAVRRDVARHATGAEQSDDITILALEVGVPPELTATITVPADDKELPHVNEFVHSELDPRLCPKRAQNHIDIAVEELFVNVCHYAYPDATPENPGTARISCTYSAEPPSVVISIADDGIPYDPLAKPDAVTPDNIADVPIGGLGILMTKRSVDEMSYERIDGSNVVTIVKKW